MAKKMRLMLALWQLLVMACLLINQGKATDSDISAVDYTLIDPKTIFLKATVVSPVSGTSYEYTVITDTGTNTGPKETSQDLVLIFTLNPTVSSTYTVKAGPAGSITFPGTQATATSDQIGWTGTISTKPTINTPVVPPTGTSVTISWPAVSADSGYTLTKYQIKWTAGTAASTLQSVDITDVAITSQTITVTRPTSGTVNYYVTVGAVFTETTTSTSKNIPWSDVVKITIGPEADLSAFSITIIDHQTLFFSGTLRTGVTAPAKYRYGTKTGSGLTTVTNYDKVDPVTIVSLNPAIGNTVGSRYQFFGVGLSSADAAGVQYEATASAIAAANLVWSLSTKIVINSVVVPASGTTVTITWPTLTVDSGYTLVKFQIKWTTGTAGSTLQSADITDTTATFYNLAVTRPASGTTNYYVTMGAVFRDTSLNTDKSIPWSSVITFAVGSANTPDLSALTVTLLDHQTIFVSGTLGAGVTTPAKYSYGVLSTAGLATQWSSLCPIFLIPAALLF